MIILITYIRSEQIFFYFNKQNLFPSLLGETGLSRSTLNSQRSTAFEEIANDHPVGRMYLCGQAVGGEEGGSFDFGGVDVDLTGEGAADVDGDDVVDFVTVGIAIVKLGAGVDVEKLQRTAGQADFLVDFAGGGLFELFA